MSKFPVSENMLYVCTGSKCAKRGGKDLFKSLKTFMKYRPNANKLEIVRIECTDRCDFAPVCNLQPENIWLKEYTGKQVLRLIDQLLNEPGKD
jgi:NADH:ubiquinone oxidoreductase subunit E